MSCSHGIPWYSHCARCTRNQVLWLLSLAVIVLVLVGYWAMYTFFPPVPTCEHDESLIGRVTSVDCGSIK